MTGKRNREGEAASFEEFFRTYQNTVFRIILGYVRQRETAEDLTVESFLNVFSRWERVRGMENPGGYLVRTAINRAKSHLRKQGRVRVVDIHEVQPAADGPTPEQKFFLDSDNALLEEELLKMGERERNVLLMKDVDRYSFSDVAGYLNMKVPTVKSLYRRAKLKLAKKLGKSR